MRSIGSMLVSKFCVFCGNPPENKNKEHVLPQWLLKETGDPKRVVKMCFNYRTKQHIEFSWNSLTMPSCTTCNDEFSGLEGQIKPIIQALLRREGVSVENYISLMDWMDKVRVGLWLNYHILQGNPTGIDPNFHIKERIGRKDRYLAVHSIDTDKMGLNAFGVESLVFHNAPICFGLKINSILLVNISADFIFSERAGFPYPTRCEYISVGDFMGAHKLADFEMNKHIEHPVLHPRMHKASIELVQPILQADVKTSASVGPQKTMRNFLGVNWDVDSYLTPRTYPPHFQAQGVLLRQLQDQTISLPELAQVIEFDSVTGDESQPIGELVAQIYEYQNMLFEKAVPDGVSVDDEPWKGILSFNSAVAEEYRKRSGG
ncbi:hypothetical protein [Pararhizobium sp. IMCC21322]|uniref:hypothetical protein n=1 Tax=Pararhizobium sp. IMCC21322 TaxID=3067903 RepID=UPI0027404ED6|nr:hypothetical protein [Pararhizobium sp. IMCC21322]